MISLLYLLVGGAAGGLVGLFLGQAWRDPYFRTQPRGFQDTILPAIVVAVGILLLQIIRIPISIARYRHSRMESERQPYRPSVVFAGGGQTVFAIAVFLVAGLGWVLAVAAHHFKG